MNELLFILGGHDGEMEVIAQLLALCGIRFQQPRRGWGDHRYTEADLGLESGEHKVVYFVECLSTPKRNGEFRYEIIDHHGELAGRPASIIQTITVLRNEAKKSLEENARKMIKPSQLALQVLEVLQNLSPATRRWFELVAANDAGYIPAMRGLGATDQEVVAIRAFDRQAQGITVEQEQEALHAVDQSVSAGRLRIVKMSHSKTAPVCDQLHGRYDQLLILSGNGEVNFFGDGALCVFLKEKFGGWNGGSGLGIVGQKAFWGGQTSKQTEVTALIEEYLAAQK